MFNAQSMYFDTLDFDLKTRKRSGDPPARMSHAAQARWHLPDSSSPALSSTAAENRHPKGTFFPVSVKGAYFFCFFFLFFRECGLCPFFHPPLPSKIFELPLRRVLMNQIICTLYGAVIVSPRHVSHNIAVRLECGNS